MTPAGRGADATGPFGTMSIADLAARLRSGGARAADLAMAAVEEAARINPELGCFVTIDAEGAERAAVAADRELARGLDRGPLHGVPVAVKDVIATAGLRTTMGSAHFADHVPQADADVVRILRSAGAVIIGKTHTHEFAYGPTGDRAFTGPARNPHDVRRMTGGSSGGSAAAVAAGIVPLALGTDTGGSVRIPAALCGAVGLRPTTGALSMSGVFPLSPTLDTVGPITRTVDDAATAWSTLTAVVGATGTFMDGVAVRGPATEARPRIGEAGMELRVGLVRSALTERVSQSQEQALLTALDRLRSAGADVVEVPVSDVGACHTAYAHIQAAEAYAIHRHRLETAPHLFEPEVLERLTAAGEVAGWQYVEAVERQRLLRRTMLDRMRGLDLLILPTVPIEAPMIDARDVDLGAGWTSPREALLALTSPWSIVGFPAVSIPIDASAGSLPASVQLVAAPHAEELLLTAAAVVHAA
jgi:aspartyl-tRNA(Asn)/glutamyl-tRNA(Gln) amidotransferase subunit A